MPVRSTSLHRGWRAAFLHFDLQNCGVNFPTVSTGNLTVTQTTFDLHPSQLGASAGQALGCRARASRYFRVAILRDGAAGWDWRRAGPLSVPRNYLTGG